MAEVGGRQVVVGGLKRQNGLVFREATDPQTPQHLRYLRTIDLADRGSGETEPP